MATTVRELDAARKIILEGDNEISPNLVFLMGPRGLAMAFDRGIFLQAVKKEFNLVEAIHLEIADFLSSAA